MNLALLGRLAGQPGGKGAASSSGGGAASSGAASSAPEPRFHLRFLGQPAASGRRQLLFTAPHLDVADAIMSTLWAWHIPVAVSVDPRGWRMASVRWFQ